MKLVICVNLSGNDKVYHYTATEEQFKVLLGGMKVVIPNKMKDDGTLSLSIGTYVGMSSGVSPDALKPIVDVIDPEGYAAALEAVKAMEAA